MKFQHTTFYANTISKTFYKFLFAPKILSKGFKQAKRQAFG